MKGTITGRILLEAVKAVEAKGRGAHSRRWAPDKVSIGGRAVPTYILKDVGREFLKEDIRLLLNGSLRFEWASGSMELVATEATEAYINALPLSLEGGRFILSTDILSPPDVGRTKKSEQEKALEKQIGKLVEQVKSRRAVHLRDIRQATAARRDLSAVNSAVFSVVEREAGRRKSEASAWLAKFGGMLSDRLPTTPPDWLPQSFREVYLRERSAFNRLYHPTPKAGRRGSWKSVDQVGRAGMEARNTLLQSAAHYAESTWNICVSKRWPKDEDEGFEYDTDGLKEQNAFEFNCSGVYADSWDSDIQRVSKEWVWYEEQNEFASEWREEPARACCRVKCVENLRKIVGTWPQRRSEKLAEWRNARNMLRLKRNILTAHRKVQALKASTG